jgi:hypothetical protein
MSSLSQVDATKSELSVFTFDVATQKVDTSQKLEKSEDEMDESDEEISEESSWEMIEKVATPRLMRNFKEACKNGITEELLENLYEKRQEVKQLDLTEMDLTKAHLEFIAGLFPYLTLINVKNARLDEHGIFHEMEVASYFENPQLVTVKGLTYIPRTNVMLNDICF